MYKTILGPSNAHVIFKWIWKCAAQLRHKIFIWLLVQDRINTINLLHRKSMHLPDYTCALCNEKIEETVLHLFWDCNFAAECWYQIIPSKRRGISQYDEISLTVSELPQQIAGCWSIWSVRNDKIFRAQAPSTQAWIHYLREGIERARIRAKPEKEHLLATWSEHHL